MHGNVIRLSDPKSCVEESEIGAKTGVETEAKAEAEVEEEDMTEDDKIADETAAEEICKAMERRCLRRERWQADLDIEDKESGKRHSSDNNTPTLGTFIFYVSSVMIGLTQWTKETKGCVRKPEAIYWVSY